MTSITNQTIAERADFAVGVAPQNIGTDDVDGAGFVDMQGVNRVAAIATTEAVAAADATVTVTLLQSDAADGTGATVLGEAVTVTAQAIGDTLLALVEAKASDLATGNRYVGARVGASESGLLGSVVLTQADQSYRS